MRARAACGHCIPRREDRRLRGNAVCASPELRRGRGRKLNSVNRISCPPKGIVERASTYFLPPGQSLVDQAKTIIRQEATRGLSVKALSTRLKVSPQLLALRFRQFGGTTPQNLILQTRLEHAKRLMKNPRIKIGAIAKQSGFSSKNRLFHVFKKRVGMTIREFRAQA